MARWTLARSDRRLRLARFWQADGDLDEAVKHARRALHLIRGHPAPPAALAVAVATVSARIERDRDQLSASQAALSWALRLLEAVPEGRERDRLLASVLTDLGDGYRRAGRYRPAIDALRRAWALAPAGDPVLAGATLMMVGIVAKELGAFDQAERCYAKVARIHESTDAASAAHAAILQHNLAGLAHARQRYREAEVHARRAVTLRRRASQATQVDIAADIAVLAAAVAGQHRHDEARELFTQAMAACRAARPPRRYEIAVHLHNLAAIDQACGRLDQAEDGYRQALAIKEELLGPRHPEVALIANNLGTLFERQERHAEAAACFRRALSIVEREYPRQHPAAAAIQHNLGVRR